MRALLALAMFFLSVASAYAFGTGVGTGGAGQATICPNLIYTFDGCSGANPAAQVKFKNFFTSHAPQSGQVLSFTPPYNSAGALYPVGNITPSASMVDPATAQPTNCTYNAAGGTFDAVTYTYGPVLYCSGVTDIHGYYFGPIGGHDATFLLINHSIAGTVSIHDNYFVNGAALYAAQVTFSSMSAVYARSVSTYTLNMYNNYWDGKWADPCCSGSSVTPIGGSPTTVPANKGGVTFVTYQGTGGATFNYNAAFNSSGHVISYLASAAATASTKCSILGNYIEGWANRGPSGHGESIFVSGGTSANPVVGCDINGNTFLQTTGACFCSATNIYPMGGLSTDYFTEITESTNTIIGANLAGGAQQIHNQMSGWVDNGDGTHANPGNIFTVGAIGSYGGASGGPYIGLNYGAQALTIFGHVNGSPASGVGSQWYVECENASTWCSSISFDISILQVLPTISGSNDDWLANYAVPQASTLNHGTVVTATIQGNYVNVSNDLVNNSTYSWAANSITCGVPISLTGNIDMVTGGAINTLGFNSGSGC